MANGTQGLLTHVPPTLNEFNEFLDATKRALETRRIKAWGLGWILAEDDHRSKVRINTGPVYQNKHIDFIPT